MRNISDLLLGRDKFYVIHRETTEIVAVGTLQDVFMTVLGAAVDMEHDSDDRIKELEAEIERQGFTVQPWDSRFVRYREDEIMASEKEIEGNDPYAIFPNDTVG